MFTSALRRLLENSPIGFVDVGARGEVHPLIDPIAQAVAVLGFEPDKAECARMQADESIKSRYALADIDSAALSDKDGAAVLHEMSAPTNASLRPTNPVFVARYNMVKWHEVGQVPIQTTTLDRVIFEQRAKELYWGEALKIDTQGTEHEILRGARRTLTERTLFASIEVSFCELYLGQSLFAEVELMMREFGFSFYAFDQISTRSRKTLDKRSYTGRERLFQADAYFFRDPFDPFNRNRLYSKRELLILSVFAMLTGFHDFALELADRLGADAKEIKDEVIARAALSADTGRAAVQALYKDVEARPQDANLLVGKFVDARRAGNDYRDIVLPT